VFLPRELILIRHAEPDHGGTLCGRTDVGLTEAGHADVARVSVLMPEGVTVITSPAARCRLTAEGLFPKATIPEDARLWEQDFGACEGQAFGDLPDLGDLDRDALASTPWPKGESFDDMYHRAMPALQSAAEVAAGGDGPVVVVAHAGIVRVGLSMALGVRSAGLTFQVPPLSFTRLQCLPKGQFAIGAVSWLPT